MVMAVMTTVCKVLASTVVAALTTVALSGAERTAEAAVTAPPRAVHATDSHSVFIARVVPDGASVDDAVSDDDALRDAVKKADSFYRDVTDGAFGFHLNGISPWTPLPGVSCHDFHRLIKKASQATDFVAGPRRHIALWIPTRSACTAPGRGELQPTPSTGGALFVAGSAFDAGTLTHELGHNLGLSHSGGTSCKGAALEDKLVAGGYIGPNKCRIHAYGDWYDVMGMTSSMMDQWGSLAPGHHRVLGTRTRDIFVQRHSMRLIIPAATSKNPVFPRYPFLELPGGQQYSLEYRVPQGQDAFMGNLAVKRGVLIRREVAESSAPRLGRGATSSLLLQASQGAERANPNEPTALLSETMGAVELGEGAVRLTVDEADDERAIVTVLFARDNVVGAPPLRKVHSVKSTEATAAVPHGRAGKNSARVVPREARPVEVNGEVKQAHLAE